MTKRYVRGSPSVASRLLPWRPGRDRPTVTAVDDVSLTVNRGEIVGLAGPSGSGKSTLLELLAGLDRPDRGAITVAGTDLASLSERELVRHRLTRVGFVFQDFRLLEAYTARTNVAIPLVELGVARARRRARAAELLERVGLADRTDHRPGQLSGGERQRVAIARALAAEPELLIADEPTGELDSDAGRRVLDELERVATDRAVLVASHDRETLAIADRVVRLRDGARVDGGGPD
nr:ABC transporter ATP-binding protein [Halovivax sp.]